MLIKQKLGFGRCHFTANLCFSQLFLQLGKKKQAFSYKAYSALKFTCSTCKHCFILSLVHHDYTALEMKDTIIVIYFISEGQFCKVYSSNVHHQKTRERTGAFPVSKSTCTVTNFCIMTIPLMCFTTKAFQTFVRGWTTLSSKETTCKMLENRIWSLCEITASHARRVKVLAAFLGNGFCWMHSRSKGLAVWGSPCWHSAAAHAKTLEKGLMSGVQQGWEETELADSRNATYSL